MKYKKYPRYKDSGIDWLGEIPSEWKCVKTAYFFKAAMGQTILKEDLEDDGIYPVYSATMEDKFFGYINNPLVILNKDDLVIPARGNSIGNVKLVTEKSTTTQTTIYCKQITNATNANFIYYYMNGLKDNLFYFVQTAIPQITVSEVISNPLLVPSIKEQQQIANFLDKATAKIDTLIEKQTKQIELLKEKRQAVISHAVTKGINPNVPMKDSGVEWLGVIPEHWEVKKLGLITSKIGSGKTPRGGSEVYSDSGILFLRSQNIYDDGLFLDEVVYISEEINNEMLNTQIKDGDILLNVTGGSIGRTCLIPSNFQKANVNQHVCIIRLNTKEDRLFISYLMKSALIKSQIDGIQNGAAREGLNFEQISGFKIVLPPKNEQNEIANYLDDKTSKIDTLIEKSKKSIELLKEKRTALISACVTGKIDVRELV